MRNSLEDRDTESRRSGHDAAMKRNSILIIILSVVVVVAAAAGLIMNLGGKESSKKTPASTSNSSAESSINVDENTNALQENKYPEVNTLIANYRKAFSGW